ncbi:MAG TPA: hypothetical protein VJZ27_13850, partial [Aggregatilineales bacterium]|nr:hypothetical protein [Aggregatilineales bacterium]
MFLIRRFQICVLIIALVIPFQSFPVQAVSPAAIATGNSTFRSDFPQGVLATLEITPEAYIQNARLNVTLDGTVLNSTDAIVPAHQPGDTITVEARWNGRSLTRDPSPPWMPLQLWWTVVDSTGNSIQTTPENHIYTDETNRRPWATTEGVYVTVHTYNQGGSFIQQAAAIGDDAVARLQLIFGYGLPFRPALVFYNQAADGDADFGSGLSVPFGGYVVGRAYPGTSGVVMLARSDSAYMQRTITHELTHLYQYQLGPQLFDA